MNPLETPIPNQTFNIELRDNEPVSSDIYDIPIKFMKKFKLELSRLLSLKIISRSKSNYSSPCFVKRKGNDDIRILLDYRKLNEKTLPLNYHFPNVFGELYDLKDAKYFSTLDMRSGYYHVNINPNDRHKTAFVTQLGKFEFNRVPFGLINGPKYFNNMMQEILFEIPNTKVFVDDIIVFTKTKEEHLKILERILSKFSEKNICLNPRKCSFLKPEISYLGLIINGKNVKPNESRLKEFNKWPEPKTKRQLQKILGLINWYRPFIPNLSSLLSPLYEKLKDNNKSFTLDENQKETVNKIYELIKSGTSLAHADPQKPFHLYSDASNIGVGSILIQDNNIIGHYSKKLSPSQTKYTVMEKELLGIMLSLKAYRKLILGNDVTIHTDNKNLLSPKDNYDNKVERWLQICNEYGAKFNFIEGKRNCIADYLSRNPAEPIQTMQEISDPERFLNDSQIVNYHNEYGHPGMTTMYLTLKELYKLTPNLKRRIKQIVQKCHLCQISKNNKHKYGNTTGKISTEDSLKHISTDVVGPFLSEYYQSNLNKDKFYIVTFTDRCSRYTKLYLTTKITGKRIINGLKTKWINKLGAPESILSDQGKCYISNTYKSFLRKNNIKAHYSSIYNPTGNSISERVNAIINSCLIIYHGRKLKEIIKIAENRINCWINRTLGTSPCSKLNIKNKIGIFPQRSTVKKNFTGRKRIPKEYMKDEKVYLKNFGSYKNEAKWIGPFVVIDIDKSKNRLLLRLNRKNVWMNIKNVKPCWSEQDDRTLLS